MATRFDNLIASEEEKKDTKKTNSFTQSLSSLKGAEDNENASKKTTTQKNKPTRPRKPAFKNKSDKEKQIPDFLNTDNVDLKEIFPNNAIGEEYKTHSVYLKNKHWRKIKKISKEQNISISAVLTKILDQIL